MKLFKKISAVTVAVLALGCGTASADVIEHIQETTQSGATIDGQVTFADGFTSILGVDGYLVGSSTNTDPDYAYGNDHITWTFDAVYDDDTQKTLHSTGIKGVMTDFLLDGSASTQDFVHSIGISWEVDAGKLVIDIGPEIATDYEGVDDRDRVLAVTVGDATTPPPVGDVPEPASLALLGLGMAGLAAARRRKG